MHVRSLLPGGMVRMQHAWRVVPLVIFVLLAFRSTTFAQPLAGTYTIGGAAPNYATIDAAITDLNARGVSAPVVFAIRTGTYTPPAAGYILSNVGTMTAANTVTFRPDANAVVTIDGSLSNSIIDFNGAKYYILDGWGGVGAVRRDMKIIQRSSGTVVRYINGAQFNVLRNTNMLSNATGINTGIVYVATTATVGNSYNKIVNNTLGDSTATLRTSTGIYMSGSTTRNSRTIIDSNDIINLGYNNGYIYAIYVGGNMDSTVVTHNRVRVTNTANAPGVYPLYGVYYSNSVATYDTIAYNQIWDLKSQYASAPTYGMYFSTVGTGVIAVHNNMIALNGDLATTVYGLYLPLGTTTNFTLDHNSIALTGAIASSSQTACIYMSTPNVTMRNNALYDTRPTTGTVNSYCIYRSSPGVVFTSTNNLCYNAGTGTNMGYYNGVSYATLAAWQTATLKDAASRSGDAHFINIVLGDLHVSATQRTAVESGGTPIAGVTTDFDGQTRSATTPDIGADEGPFLPLLANDMAADRFLSPISLQTTISNTAFAPQAQVVNAGLNTQVGVNVRYRILNALSVVVYSDIQTVASLPSGTPQVLNFNTSGNQSGSTSLTAGTYTIELTTQLAGDQDPTSDVITGTITVKDPLNGIYTIDKFGAGARNYTSFTAALADLNFVGVNAPVTFQIANGTYDNTTETFPLLLKTAPGVTATNNVTFRPAVGATVTLTSLSAASSSTIIIDGGKYYTFEGSNTVGGTTRNWTIRNTESTTSSTFWLRNDADLNTIRNCIVQGNANASVKFISSTTQPGAIVYIGQTTAATGNDSNVVQNCQIGDASGTYRNNVAVCIFGTSGKPDNGNHIIGNDILNFGNAGTYGYGLDAYGEQAGTEFRNNDVHMTVAAPAAINTLYGIYTDYSPGYAINSLFIGNRIYKLTSVASNWTVYGIYHWQSTSNANTLIANNMISLAETGDHTYYGIYFASSTGTTNLYHNSFYFGGASTGTRVVYGIYKSSSNSITSRNNIFYSARSGGSASNYGFYISTTSGWLSNNNTVSFNPAGANFYTAYYNGALATLANYQAASGQDLNSFGVTAPFIDPVNGNLHLNTQPVFNGESTGATGLGIATDYDQQVRDVSYPDIGADEGDFNGGGIHVVAPNGGEKFSVDYNLDVVFTVNRPLPVRIDFSTDAGATWTPKGTTNATLGSNTFTVPTPSNINTTSRVRVVSTKNQWEADTSDANFELVLPVFAVTAPNGGETVTPTDTTMLTWTSQFAPPTMRLELDYSTDGGSTWNLIDNNIYSNNLPATNTYGWIVPNKPTTQAKVRIKVYGGNISDASDNNFTITVQPSVVLAYPVGGEQFLVGLTETIRWTSVLTTSVKLEYSTDAGSTWLDVVPNGMTLPAYLGSFAWTVPNTPSNTVKVRVMSVERPRFNSVSAMLAIVKSTVQVLVPNGGEKYEQNAPVNVVWTSAFTNQLRVDYSPDGVNFTTVAASVPAAAGNYSFTPTPTPTKLARVRLVNVAHPEISDASDAPFEILQAASITVYAPAAGDQLTRNSTTVISWDAPRISLINIYYSLTGGAPWTTIATNINAAEGSRQWIVPNQVTTLGKIRITDAGGPTIGESGIFSMIDQSTASVHVVAPNGGEKINQGDNTQIRWTQNGLTTVTVSYYDGIAWNVIARDIAATASPLDWQVTSAPGKKYRVKVESTSPAVSDESDLPFEVVHKLQPLIVLLYPNGGEVLPEDSVRTINWTAQDVTGNVMVEWSPDSGKHWQTLTSTVTASAQKYDWTVPHQATKLAMVRVSKPNSTPFVGDSSAAVFEISPTAAPQLQVLTPNGGETWRSPEKRMITWALTSGVDALDIYYSLDGGQNWDTVKANVPMSPNQYEWLVPKVTSKYTAALVKIVNHASTGQSDISDAPFTVDQPIAGVNAVVAGLAGLKTLGAYPNPNTGVTELRWTQGHNGSVEIRLYGAQGSSMGTYDAGHRDAGEQRYVLNAPELVSGMYIWEVRMAEGVARGVMTVVK